MATWILSWDDNGLETALNWTDLQNNYTHEMLVNGNAPDITQNIPRLQMRARFNNHRKPEIYAVNLDDEMDLNTICNYFHNNPEPIKELVRKHSHWKIW